MSSSIQQLFKNEQVLIWIGLFFFMAIMITAYQSLRAARVNPKVSWLADSTARRLKEVQASVEEMKELMRQREGLPASNDADRSGMPPEVGQPPPRPSTPEPALNEFDLDPDLAMAKLGRRSRLAPPEVAKNLLVDSLSAADVKLSIEDALRLYQTLSDQQNRLEERRSLRETTEQQLASTSSVKSSMISLFVMFNLGVIAALIFVPSVVTAGKELILGLYISLATFIVYVYRASNARALVLLAIKEDLKRYHDAEKYLNNLRPKTPPSDRDIEILKLLLTNRSEREKHGEHPYELALKGITNSTILLKGGRVASVLPRRKEGD